MNSEYIEGLENYWYLYYYFKRGSTNDYLSLRLEDLKEDKEQAIKIFSALCKLSSLNSQGVKFDYVTRVLGSNELKAGPGSRVAPLAKGIAACVGAEYISKLLIKTKKTRSFKILNKADRIKEIKGVYAIGTPYNLDNKNILVVDDITTTGTTFTEIARAIKEKYPTAKVYGFSLGRTKTKGWWRAPEKNEDEWIEAYKAFL